MIIVPIVITILALSAVALIVGWAADIERLAEIGFWGLVSFVSIVLILAAISAWSWAFTQ